MLIALISLATMALFALGLLFHNNTIRMPRLWFAGAFVGAAVLTTFVGAALAATAAAAVEPQTWWQALLSGLIPHIVMVIVGVLGLLGTILLQRIGIVVKSQQLEAMVAAGVGFAEQLAMSRLNAGGPPITGEEKKRAAVDFILQLADAHNLGAYAREHVNGLIEAKLGQISQGG